MANTYLTRTFGSAGNRKTWTWSAWVKRSSIGGTQNLLNAGHGSTPWFTLTFNSDKINFAQTSGSSASWTTSSFFRDTSAWYHIVLAVDTTSSTSTMNGSSSDRMRLYVNGTQHTVTSGTIPSQNSDLQVNQAIEHRMGTAPYGNAFDGLMSHVHFIDGTAYTPSAFGETDSTTGEWKINTSPSVTYGTNGFFILKDGNSVTDQSGNSNNFTVGGGTLTKTEDSPSNVFATGNPLLNKGNPTYSNGNNTCSASGSSWKSGLSTIGASSGKYYFEYKWVSDSGSPKYNMVGIANVDNIANSGSTSTHDLANSYLYEQGGPIFTSGSGTTFGNTYTVGDIIGCAVDLDNNKIYFHKNGTYQASGNPSSGTYGYTINAGTYYLGASLYSNGTSIGNFNFGNGYFGTTAVSSAGTNASNNGIFEYDVPTGYTALSTKGLNL